jgi:hypothetical protein
MLAADVIADGDIHNARTGAPMAVTAAMEAARTITNANPT